LNQEFEVHHNDKESLLNEIDSLKSAENGLGFKTVFTALAALIVVLSVAIPKIYLSASIYYLSLETDSLYSSYKALKEENRYLEQKLEFMRYKNSVLNSLD
jgi:hypothetical protein